MESPPHSSAHDETERLLHDVFLAYSVPCGVVKGSGEKDPMGRVASADAMDEIGWQKLCSDCKIDEDSSVPPALPIFKEVALKSPFLVYAGFLKVLKTVARVRYGDENLARLLYFKIFRFARSVTQQKSAPSTPRTPRLSDTWRSSSGADSCASTEYFVRLHALHTSIAHDCPPMLEAEKDVMAAFERYRAGMPGVGLQGLAQMCADVKLLPSPLSYVQIRAHFNYVRPGDDGLNYMSFLNTLLVLARLAFDDVRGDPAEKLVAALRKHLPAPPTQIAMALMQGSSDEEDEENNPQGAGVNDPSVSAVGKWIANKTELAQGLEESLSRVKQEAQRRLEKLAEDFAKKQVELHEQRVVAERELEAEVQLELAQNAARSTRQRRSSARPSVERLNLEEKIAALDRSRACRPSRSLVDDGSMEKLDSERAELVRKAIALKAAEEARHVAEAENDESKTAQKITENGKRKLKRLTAESERVEDAMQMDMKKRHEEIAKWYDTATRMCKERQVMNSNAPREVSRPSPAKSKSSPAPRPKSAKAGNGSAIRPEKLSPKGQAAAHRRDIFLPLDVGKTVQRSALSRLQSRLQEVFSSIYLAFVFLDANDKGVLERQDLNRQIARVCPEVSGDQIQMEMIEGAEDAKCRDQDRGIPLELFLRNLSWHPIPPLRRAQREAIAEARRQKQKALTEFYNWQLRRDPITGGARTVSGITLDDLALLPVSEIAEAAPSGASSARSVGAYITWKGTLRKYSDDRNDQAKSAPRARPNTGSAVNFTPESTPRSFGASTPRSIRQKESSSIPRAWISDGQKEIAMTQLLREKRKLAVQLLETERKLMEVGGPVAPRDRSPALRRERLSNNGKPKSASDKIPGSATVDRGHREFVGPKGPYRELTATDRLIDTLRDDRPATLEKCMTKTGLFIAAPPLDMRVQKGEARAASWRDPTHLQEPTTRTSTPQRAVQNTRNPAQVKRSSPNRSQDHKTIIDECLELVAGLMDGRQVAHHPELTRLQSGPQTRVQKSPFTEDNWPQTVDSASSDSDRDHGTGYISSPLAPGMGWGGAPQPPTPPPSGGALVAKPQQERKRVQDVVEKAALEKQQRQLKQVSDGPVAEPKAPVSETGGLVAPKDMISLSAGLAKLKNSGHDSSPMAKESDGRRRSQKNVGTTKREKEAGGSSQAVSGTEGKKQQKHWQKLTQTEQVKKIFACSESDSDSD